MQLPLPGTEQLKLRPGSHKPFNGVEHLLKVAVVWGYQRGAKQRTPVLVLQSGLRS